MSSSLALSDWILTLLQRGGKEYNLVCIHPDDGSVEYWTAEGSADKLRADFADYDPRYVLYSVLVVQTLTLPVLRQDSEVTFFR